MGEIRIKRDVSGWDNRPAHQFTNGQWVDIPTHKYTNGRWQGELTSQSPLKFRADGEMLDWRVEGRKSENLFDIGTSATDYASPSYTNLTVSNDTLSMKLSSQAGMTYAIRTQRQTRKGAVTFTVDTDCNTAIGIIVKIRNNDDTRWLTSSDTSISGFTYNNVYGGWYRWTLLNNGHPIQAITIPNVGSYYYAGFLFAHSSSAVGNVYSVTNIQLLEGTYTSETIPPYEPYGGVGDWDETEQKYRIPVRIEGENLFNPETSTPGFIDASGNEHPSEKSLTSGYISVNANTMYTLGLTGDTDSTNLTAYCFYNSNKEFISSSTYVPSANGNIVNVLTPNDCAYFRFSYNHLRELVEFVEGQYNTLPPYSTTTNLFTNHQLMDGDSIDYTTTETQIPIATGNNTLTVDTAVQPKSVFVKFEG